MTDFEPHWVKYHRELIARNEASHAHLNPVPPKSTSAVPLLKWERTINWWPKHDWERYDTVTCGSDLSPADRGYKIRRIQDMALLGEDAEGFPRTSIEVIYSPHICDECPQECFYQINHKHDTPNEEFAIEGEFKTIDEAREAALQALAYLLEKSPL
ncbi:MAG: hypothetical protein FWD51_06350 [Betaproteobacteria bacterium]|nr:hypothetical protein [Betaproteobacteria bacterium]